MSVAIDVSSELRERSTSWRRWSGRRKGRATPNRTGAAISTTTPSRGEVVSTMAATARNEMNCDPARAMISLIAPNSSESLDATLRISPVGERRGRMWPIWAALRVTIMVVP